MSDRIDTVSARSRLKCRREPYWHKINQGSFLGFRQMTDDVNGVWQVRYREESGRHITRTLGKFEKCIPSERFDKAMSAARDWLSHLEMGGATESITVMEACDAYVAKIRALKGDKSADDLEDRYRRWVGPDPIQKLEITKLTQAHALLHGDEVAAVGDAGYQGVEKREENLGKNVTWHVAMKRSKRKELPNNKLGRMTEKLEHLKASVRAKVEHPFHVVKNLFKHRKARYRGLAKNTAQLFTLFGFANLVLAGRQFRVSETRAPS